MKAAKTWLTRSSLVRIRNGTVTMENSLAVSFSFFFLNKFIYLFIYLFLAALGLHCCTQAFSSCGEWGLLTVMASVVAEHGL